MIFSEYKSEIKFMGNFQSLFSDYETNLIIHFYYLSKMNNFFLQLTIIFMMI